MQTSPAFLAQLPHVHPAASLRVHSMVADASERSVRWIRAVGWGKCFRPQVLQRICDKERDRMKDPYDNQPIFCTFESEPMSRRRWLEATQREAK